MLEQWSKVLRSSDEVMQENLAKLAERREGWGIWRPQGIRAVFGMLFSVPPSTSSCINRSRIVFKAMPGPHPQRQSALLTCSIEIS